MKKQYYSTISDMSKLIREEKISPVKIVDECLARIGVLNPKLNAFITVVNDKVQKQAKQAELEIKKGNWRGPLHGIPVGIKDFYDTAGIQTTAAFEHFKDRIPKKDAVAVAKLKEAGAIVIGKTNMHTLGMGTTGLVSFFGPVKNPWNSEYIPGGSSSGSAVAVASGLCYATLDTDAIGSCRLPASVCGVIGFKGTYELIDMKGILEGTDPPDEMIQWLTHAGITARNVDDAALMLNVLAEQNMHTKATEFPGDLSTDRIFRVGVANNFEVDEEVLKVFEKAVDKIRDFGYLMSEIAAPFWDFNQGLGNIKSDRRDIAKELFKDIDVLILPTIPNTTPSVRQADKNVQALSAKHTVFANYYGLPAVSILTGLDKHGLPLGLQIIGKPWDELAVLQFANQYQTATEYSNKHPIE